VLAALYDDPRRFTSELHPALGPGIPQCIGPTFHLWSTFLGDPWSIGAWDAMRTGAADHLPELYVETLLEWVRDSTGERARRTDVHAHYLPAPYRTALREHGHAQPDGFPRIPEWSPEEHVAAMDRLGIRTPLLSISSPVVHLADVAYTRVRPCPSSPIASTASRPCLVQPRV